MKNIKSHFTSDNNNTSPTVDNSNSMLASSTNSERDVNQQLLDSGIEPPAITSSGDNDDTVKSEGRISPTRRIGMQRLNISFKKDKSPPPQPPQPPPLDSDSDSEDDGLLVGFPNDDNTPTPTISPYTQPVDFTPTTTTTTITTTSTKTIKNQKRLDQYGFITNLDDQGLLRDELFPTLPGGAYTPSSTTAQPPLHHLEDDDGDPIPRLNNSTKSIFNSNKSNENLSTMAAKRESRLRKKLSKRREKKWADMIAHWPSILASPPKYSRMRSRVRKGIPNSVRGQAWANISKAAQRRSETEVGVYAELIRRSCGRLSVVDDNYGEEEEEDFDSTRNWYDVDSKAITMNIPEQEQSDHPPPDGVVMKETIERDINRTFPRHSMFYDSATDNESEEEDSTDTSYDRLSECDSTGGGGGGGGNGGGNITGQLMMNWGGNHEDIVEVLPDGQPVVPLREWNTEPIDDVDGTTSPRPSTPAIIPLDSPSPSSPTKSSTNNGSAPIDTQQSQPQPQPQPQPTPSTKEAQQVVAAAAANRAKMVRLRKQQEKDGVDLTVAKGGQASLRRVLRAYSIYDVDVGYCQGMNFIAAMFITYVSEEEAFWLLVAIMKDSPCRMRGLFGEGMSEAHQVLFVAQKLITQFLPRLSRHFAAENVDITMFATQWLLTMYTSSFPFDIVTRVWDCYLVEGWKVAYRVMLALLEGCSAELLKLRFEDILGYLKDLPHRVKPDELLEATFKIPLRKKHITKYAKQWEKMQKDKDKKIEKDKKKLAKEKEREEKEKLKE